jgi:hypothetical protein
MRQRLKIFFSPASCKTSLYWRWIVPSPTFTQRFP